MTVLITGGIGCGKSEVAAWLVSKGYEVYSCDDRAKALYDEVPGLLERIEKALGCQSLRNPSGKLDRKALAEVIFSDSLRRAALEAILYVELRRDLEQFLDSHEGLVFVESANAFAHREFDGLFDAVVEVRTNDSLRRERVLRRNPDLSHSELESRISAQQTIEGADFVIHNDGDLDSLHSQIDRITEQLI